jgi:hypothetical protein
MYNDNHEATLARSITAVLPLRSRNKNLKRSQHDDHVLHQWQFKKRYCP